MRVLEYDAFTTVPGQGNPAGVVLDARDLSDEAMQRIAKAVGFNETVFVLPSETADVRLRYFTPGHETNLCGHATVGAVYALRERGLRKEIRSIETKAGVLPVEIRVDTVKGTRVRMRQAEPLFHDFEGDRADLAASMGLTPVDLDARLPIRYGSTGSWTLLVPIRSLEAFSRMRPDPARFPEILTWNPRASVHPFVAESVDPACQAHARHFSSPFSQTREDPVTGTASGVMAAYWLDAITGSDHVAIAVEQGLEIGRPGVCHAEAAREGNGMVVHIEGLCVYGGPLPCVLQDIGC